MRKYLAFDLEIRNSFPEGVTDWREAMPLGISCAAVYDGEVYTTWNNADAAETGNAMTKAELVGMILDLSTFKQKGYTILTWNGLGFDFPLLAVESDMHEVCRILAIDHVDSMYHFFCNKGYYLSLNKAAKGQDLSGKLEGMDGSMAPILWRSGTIDDRRKVIRYLHQDVKTTYDVAVLCEQQQFLHWKSNRNRDQFFDFAKWLTVREASALSFPDTSWMTDPPERAKFTDWIKEYL